MAMAPYTAALYPVGTEQQLASQYRAAYVFTRQNTIPLFLILTQNIPFPLL